MSDTLLLTEGDRTCEECKGTGMDGEYICEHCENGRITERQNMKVIDMAFWNQVERDANLYQPIGIAAVLEQIMERFKPRNLGKQEPQSDLNRSQTDGA